MKAVCAALLFASTLAGAVPLRNVIVDTDAGSDDLMAIAFLLARKDINIEAITIVNGLAHVPAGAKNILRLLELSGKTSIPVYAGSSAPLEGTNEFPESWRTIADELPGVSLPQTDKREIAGSALDYLRERLANAARPVSILALGPLTNIAEVLIKAPRSVAAISDLVVMGGAIRVPGNLPSGGSSYSDNRTAEWNIYIDPLAAEKVFNAVTKLRLIPLDACNSVPVDAAFLQQFQKGAKSKLGVLVAELLTSNKMLIDQKIFYAWDPLAAVALVDPAVVKISSAQIVIQHTAPEEGRTQEINTGRPVRAALSADPVLFRKVFFATLR